jgi:beta-phosphoglucomutase-like phosphatase (HAD superfamily)
MSLEAVIFDMDGVLIDTVHYNFESFNSVLSEYGVHIQPLKKYIGRSLEDQLDLWKNDFPQIPNDLDYNTFAHDV